MYVGIFFILYINMTIKIIEWFDEYHWTDCDKSVMANLYDALILEETKELQQAIMEWNTVWIADAICDLVRVTTGLWYYLWEDIEMSVFHYIWHAMLWEDMFEECMAEVIRSNFTKSKDTDENWKIIKWQNYEEPQLWPIIERYKSSFNK